MATARLPRVFPSGVVPEMCAKTGEAVDEWMTFSVPDRPAPIVWIVHVLNTLIPFLSAVPGVTPKKVLVARIGFSDAVVRRRRRMWQLVWLSVVVMIGGLLVHVAVARPSDGVIGAYIIGAFVFPIGLTVARDLLWVGFRPRRDSLDIVRVHPDFADQANRAAVVAEGGAGPIIKGAIK